MSLHQALETGKIRSAFLFINDQQIWNGCTTKDSKGIDTEKMRSKNTYQLHLLINLLLGEHPMKAAVLRPNWDKNCCGYVIVHDKDNIIDVVELNGEIVSFLTENSRALQQKLLELAG
eukprot:GDKK01063796.1.p1 GENE.GDKK01063796.1~~GDKK01063796.1.p1  ORF type:complete len:118 (-),score=6.75 GDKK01063796.1:283-636(-)